MDEYYIVTAYENGIPVVATLTAGGIGAGIDASTDIDTIIARLTAIQSGIAGLPTTGGITQSQVTTAIDNSVDLDTIIARLTSIRDGAITQAQVASAIDAAVDINSIITLLASINSGAITQAQVTTAINGAVDIDTMITRLASLDAKLPALDSNRVPVSDPVTSYSLGETLTAAVGTNWTALASGATKNITVRNRANTNIDLRIVGGSTILTLANGEDVPLPVLANSNEWEIRRTDTSNTQVTVRFLRWA